MNLLQDKDRVVYVVKDPELPFYARREDYEVVYMPGRRRPMQRFPVYLLIWLPFALAAMATIFLVFAVDDVQWLMRRIAVILAIFFMFGMVGSVLGGLWMAIKDSMNWRHYDG